MRDLQTRWKRGHAVGTLSDLLKNTPAMLELMCPSCVVAHCVLEPMTTSLNFALPRPVCSAEVLPTAVFLMLRYLDCSHPIQGRLECMFYVNASNRLAIWASWSC
jgi:hypothetical protein